MSRAKLLRAAAVAVIAGGGLACLSRFGSLQWPTVLVYSGLVTILCGMVSVVLPPRWLGFAKRRHGLLAGVAAGLALFAAGLLWPAGEHSTPAPATKLDAFLPAYHFHERHEIIVAASPERSSAR
jgi:hypothetical protein